MRTRQSSADSLRASPSQSRLRAVLGCNDAGARILGCALLTFLLACSKPEPAPQSPPQTRPVTLRQGCNADQVRVTTELVDACVDLYEAPGFGTQPEHFSFEAAVEYCDAKGRRLCSEQEWEAACRGPDGWLYPYGDEFDAGACVVERSQAASVGNSNSCRSGFGAYDLSGNAAEWVDGPLLKGGDFSSDAFGARCGARTRAASAEATLSGVRCCSPPTP